MVDILLPPRLRIARTRMTYVDSTGVSVAEFTGAKKTASKGGDRLAASLEFSPHGGRSSTYATQRACLLAFIARLRGKQNRAYLYDPAYKRRGSFPTAELLQNNAFESGTTGWSTSSANIVITAQDGHLRSVRAAVGADETIRAAVATVVSGATYAARVLSYTGSGAMDYRLRLGTSAGGSEISAEGTDNTTAQLRTLTGVASGTSMHYSILDGITSRSTGNFQEFAYASLSRCALVNGASQTGNTLNIDALPTSTDGLLLLGDMFEVITSKGSELKMVTQPLNSNSSGQGVLFFEPAMRGSPADNAAVIINQPLGRFIFTGDVPQWMNDPGIFSTASLDFEEAA